MKIASYFTLMSVQNKYRQPNISVGAFSFNEYTIYGHAASMAVNSVFIETISIC